MREKPRVSTKAKPVSRQVTGVWGECESCGQRLPLHPELRACGCCTFGEASAMMAFDGTWTEAKETPRA